MSINWIHRDAAIPANRQVVIGWDSVRNIPRGLTFHVNMKANIPYYWITESKVELPYDDGPISHWAECSGP